MFQSHSRTEVSAPALHHAHPTDRPPPGDDPFGGEIARGLVGSGFRLHHCAAWHAARRLGAVCVRPAPARPDRDRLADAEIARATRGLLAGDGDPVLARSPAGRPERWPG